MKYGNDFNKTFDVDKAMRYRTKSKALSAIRYLKAKYKSCSIGNCYEFEVLE